VHVHEEANLVPIHRNGLGAVHPVSGHHFRLINITPFVPFFLSFLVEREIKRNDINICVQQLVFFISL
jgi:hypothetical protein